MAQTITCTRSRHLRACDPRRLADQLAGLGRPATVIEDVVDAYTYLVNTSGPNDLIVATGSLFLVGDLRAALCYAKERRPMARAVA